VTLKDLKINGIDLIKLGFQEGKTIGLILNDLLDQVIANPELNEKEILINNVVNVILKNIRE
jgi:tRNA nucleotidyltransferase (CCA-adding enzyme)